MDFLHVIRYIHCVTTFTLSFQPTDYQCVICSMISNENDVLSINNNSVHSYVASIYIYHSELEIKDTTEASPSALFLDILLNINDNG